MNILPSERNLNLVYIYNYFVQGFTYYSQPAYVPVRSEFRDYIANVFKKITSGREGFNIEPSDNSSKDTLDRFKEYLDRLTDEELANIAAQLKAERKDWHF